MPAGGSALARVSLKIRRMLSTHPRIPASAVSYGAAIFATAFATGVCVGWMTKGRKKKKKKERTTADDFAGGARDGERDRIDLASEDSFPASDPPSFTGTTA